MATWTPAFVDVPAFFGTDLSIWPAQSMTVLFRSLTASVIPPITNPIIGGVFPVENDTIQRTQAITFTVTDVSPLRRVIISIINGGDIVEEIVHEGVAFAATYSGGYNSRVNIDGGFRYSILRVGGWKGSSVKLRIIAVDAFGNLARKSANDPQALYTWPVAA